MAAYIVFARTTDLKGVTSQTSATREAPAQAELRPTCAGTPRGNLAQYLNAKTLILTGRTQRSQTSTRRFFSRPSSVSLEAIGKSFPNPLTNDGLTPRICNCSATAL